MWRRRRSNPESDAVRRAREQAQQAQAERRRVEAQWPHINRISEAFAAVLKRNHFGEQIEKAALRKASP